jgi:hypothetical protein
VAPDAGGQSAGAAGVVSRHGAVPLWSDQTDAECTMCQHLHRDDGHCLGLVIRYSAYGPTHAWYRPAGSSITYAGARSSDQAARAASKSGSSAKLPKQTLPKLPVFAMARLRRGVGASPKTRTICGEAGSLLVIVIVPGYNTWLRKSVGGGADLPGTPNSCRLGLNCRDLEMSAKRSPKPPRNPLSTGMTENSGFLK